jgi:hypothetical protein
MGWGEKLGHQKEIGIKETWGWIVGYVANGSGNN